MRFRLPFASLARAICSGVRITKVRLCFMLAFPAGGSFCTITPFIRGIVESWDGRVAL